MDPRALAAAGQALSRLAAESRDHLGSVGSLVSRAAGELGSEHAGPALLATWRELAEALEGLSDGYGELAHAFSVLAPAYSSFDTRLLPR